MHSQRHPHADSVATQRPHAVLAGMFIFFLFHIILFGGQFVAGAERGTTPSSGNGHGESSQLDVPVSFRLIDGTRMIGRLTAWDGDGFDGTFGRRAWDELNHEDVWRIFRRVMDQDLVDDWIMLGRVLLLMRQKQPEAERWATRAFRHVTRLQPDDGELRVQRVKDEVKSIERERAEQRRRAAREQLRTSSPEADPWSATPWPDIDRNQQRNAVLTMKADARQALERAGLERDPIETAFFLLYSDIERSEAVRFAMLIEQVHEQASLALERNPRRNIFWGKAAVFILREQDRFRLIEADAFGQFVSPEAVGMTHPIGPKVFIALRRDVDAQRFELELVRQTMRGILHRHISPRRLPAWANDGLGYVIADRVLSESHAVLAARRSALRFIREGGQLEALVGIDYDHELWSANELQVAAVGGLLVELMIRERPRDFAGWVEAVKSGDDWREAMENVFGVPKARFLATAKQYYRVND